MNNFTFYCPTKFVFGKDQEKNVGKLCAEQGATRSSSSTAAAASCAAACWTACGSTSRKRASPPLISVALSPTPAWRHVREGIEIVKREGIDFLLAIGGGSVIDTAKGIGNRRAL